MDKEEKVILTMRQMLENKFPSNEYALLEEVRDKAGFDARRSADYILVNLWPSRGLHISGFEQKASRTDWLRELKKPEKAEAIFQYCDFFWLLTGDESVAKIEEIPDTWGWMSAKNNKIRVLKEAPKLQPVLRPTSFIVAMIKRAVDKSGYVHRDQIQKKIEEAVIRGENNSKFRIDELQNEISRLKKVIQDFDQASGTNLAYRYGESAQQTGAIIKFLRENHPDHIHKRLVNLMTAAEDIRKNVEFALKKFQTV